MQRERLTPARIARFTCPPDKDQDFLWDTEAQRLAVRATRAGAKTFVFEKKLNRDNIRKRIGDVAAWLLNSVWEGKGDDYFRAVPLRHLDGFAMGRDYSMQSDG